MGFNSGFKGLTHTSCLEFQLVLRVKLSSNTVVNKLSSEELPDGLTCRSTQICHTCIS